MAIGDAADSLSDDVAALILICNASADDTAESKTLQFVTEKLGDDVKKIQASVESVRYRRPTSTREPANETTTA